MITLKEQQKISAFLDKNHNIYSLSRIIYFKTLLYLRQTFRFFIKIKFI